MSFAWLLGCLAAWLPGCPAARLLPSKPPSALALVAGRDPGLECTLISCRFAGTDTSPVDRPPRRTSINCPVPAASGAPWGHFSDCLGELSLGRLDGTVVPVGAFRKSRATLASCSVATRRRVQPGRAPSRQRDGLVESNASEEIDWPVRSLRPLNPIPTPHLIQSRQRPSLPRPAYKVPTYYQVTLGCTPTWGLMCCHHLDKTPDCQPTPSVSYPCSAGERQRSGVRETGVRAAAGAAGDMPCEHPSSFGEVGVLGPLPLFLCRVAALLARLHVPELDSPPRINVHH